MKENNITLESWYTHHNSEGWKKNPGNVMEGILADNRSGSEVEEALCQMDKIPRKGVTTKKGQPKNVRSAKLWTEDLQVLG